MPPEAQTHTWCGKRGHEDAWMLYLIKVQDTEEDLGAPLGKLGPFV
jgi:hypothetical protein